MLRGTVWIISDLDDGVELWTRQVVQVDGAISAQEFRDTVESGRSTVEPQLAGARVEYGPIGRPWPLRVGRRR